MEKATRERDRNRYAGTCMDCRTHVEANQGRLYRYSGANLNALNYNKSALGRMKRRRGAQYAYAVRCEACYTKHDKPCADESESSGITYTGYGQNSHAICGN